MMYRLASFMSCELDPPVVPINVLKSQGGHLLASYSVSRQQVHNGPIPADAPAWPPRRAEQRRQLLLAQAARQAAETVAAQARHCVRQLPAHPILGCGESEEQPHSRAHAAARSHSVILAILDKKVLDALGGKKPK